MSHPASLYPAGTQQGDAPGPPVAGGLTSDDARRRIRQFGWNEPASERGHAFFFQCVSLLTNPILLILLAASLVSALLGQTIEAAVIATMLLLSASIDLSQSYRAQLHAERLKQQVAVESTVLRDGAWIELRAGSWFRETWCE